MDDAKEILQAIHARIARASARVGRDPADVTLVGVSKIVPAERIVPFIEAGLTDLGENYVQEGSAKIDEIARQTSLPPVHWHFIGGLQSNKAKQAVERFELIHSVDRPSLATAIDKAAGAMGKVQDVLLQVNIGMEGTKAGCSLEELPALVEQCRQLPNLKVCGLMCLPPFEEDVEAMRPYFRQLREARDRYLPPENDREKLYHLSMGMTHDFEIAIEEGATLIRIGTGIFGKR